MNRWLLIAAALIGIFFMFVFGIIASSAALLVFAVAGFCMMTAAYYGANRLRAASIGAIIIFLFGISARVQILTGASGGVLASIIAYSGVRWHSQRATRKRAKEAESSRCRALHDVWTATREILEKTPGTRRQDLLPETIAKTGLDTNQILLTWAFLESERILIQKPPNTGRYFLAKEKGRVDPIGTKRSSKFNLRDLIIEAVDYLEEFYLKTLYALLIGIFLFIGYLIVFETILHMTFVPWRSILSWIFGGGLPTFAVGVFVWVGILTLFADYVFVRGWRPAFKYGWKDVPKYSRDFAKRATWCLPSTLGTMYVLLVLLGFVKPTDPIMSQVVPYLSQLGGAMFFFLIYVDAPLAFLCGILVYTLFAGPPKLDGSAYSLRHGGHEYDLWSRATEHAYERFLEDQQRKMGH